MKTSYIGKKTAIKGNFQEYCEKRLKKLDKFFDDAAAATIVVSRENDSKETVEVTVRSQGLFFRAEKSAADRQSAMDLAVDVLQNQIVRNKTRFEKKFKNITEPAFEALETEGAPAQVGEDIIVKTKKFNVEVMDTDEAILRMNLLGHEFFMFRSVETGEINVIYRRRDGNYGLLEPIQA